MEIGKINKTFFFYVKTKKNIVILSKNVSKCCMKVIFFYLQHKKN